MLFSAWSSVALTSTAALLDFRVWSPAKNQSSTFRKLFFLPGDSGAVGDSATTPDGSFACSTSLFRFTLAPTLDALLRDFCFCAPPALGTTSYLLLLQLAPGFWLRATVMISMRHGYCASPCWCCLLGVLVA